jgi:hypothetical protein
MATSALPQAPRRPRPAIGFNTAAIVAYGLGAAALAVEAVVHVQQFASLFNDVRWIGPLFIANAVAIVVVLAGLAYRRTRILAAAAGVVISAAALGGLIISYGTGLFGWQEAGFRTPTAIAMVSEVAAVILLALGMAASALERGR